MLKIDLLFAYNKYKKRLRVLSKNNIVMLLPVPEGTPLFINLFVMDF